MPKTKEEILAALKELDEGEDYVAGFNDIMKEANKNAKSVADLYIVWKIKCSSYLH